MTRRPLTSRTLPQLALVAGLALTGLGLTGHSAQAGAAIQCDNTYENFVFPDATPFGQLTSTSSGGDTVVGTDYSLTYTYSFDFTTKQATIHAVLTSTKYYLTATLLWWVRASDDGGLPIWDEYGVAPTQSHDSVISFDVADFKALYAISWRLQPCSAPASPTPTPSPTPDATPSATATPTVVAGSGAAIPATGTDSNATLWVGAGLAGLGFGALALGRRPRRAG